MDFEHQMPPVVYYEKYKTYVNLFREYSEKAGDISLGSTEPSLRGDG